MTNPAPAPSGERRTLGLSGLRSVAILGLFVSLVLGQAWVVVARREFWPLSNYPMYADTQGPTVSAVQADGILADGSRHALGIRSELAPFDPSRILGFLRRLGKGSRGRERRLEATRALLGLYEQHRESGRERGPQLVGLEVFETTWRIASYAKNRDRPQRRRLLASTQAEADE